MFTLLMGFVLLLQRTTADNCVALDPKPPYCSEGQIKTEIVTAKIVDGTCLYDFKLLSETPKCTKKIDVQGICEKYRDGQLYCMAEDIIHYTEIDDQCRCVDKYVKQLRTCCCPDSTRFTICDQNKGVVMTVTADYQLINDENGYSCKAIVNRTSTAIQYRAETTNIGVCKVDGYQMNVITTRYLDETCAIRSWQRNDTRLCACAAKERTVQECNGDLIVTETYKSVLECCDCSCICKETLVSRRETTSECPKARIDRTDCIYPNNLRQVTYISYKLVNCKCTEIRDSRFEECIPCQYKVYNRTVGPCSTNLDTETITVLYKDTDCQIKTKVTKELCSCQSPPPPQTICQDGSWNTITIMFIFDRKSKTCITKSTKVSKPVLCRRPEIITGRCGVEKKYYKKRQTTEYKVDQMECKCKSEKKVEFIVCGCPSIEYSKWQCSQNEHRIRRMTSYVMNLDRNVCERKVDTIDVMIKCQGTKPDRTVQVNKCLFIVHKYFTTINNCQCKYYQVSRRVVTCCPDPPPSTVRCVGIDNLVTTHTMYRISNDRTECLSVAFKSSQKIVCKEYVKTSRTDCRDGRYVITKRHYKVKACRCVLDKIDRTPVVIECNVGKPLMKAICKNNLWFISTTTWVMKDCQCISSSKYHQKSIECPVQKRDFGKCNRSTGLIKVRTIYYDLVECKCVVRVKFHTTPCLCFKPDKIKKSKCFGKKRIVYKLRYERVKESCQWIVMESESEDCECPSKETITTCKDKITKLSTTTSYDLVLQTLKLPVMRCIPKKETKTTPVDCDNEYNYLTKCINFKQSIVSCSYEVVNCECTETCTTECMRGCNCQDKNECQTRCVNNEIQRICHQYSDSCAEFGSQNETFISTCAVSETIEIVPVSCFQPQPQRSCTKCTINRDNGLYKRCTILRREKVKCRCQLRSQIMYVLCRCREESTTSFCRNNRVVVSTTRYSQLHNKCIPNQSEFVNPEIDCPHSYFITNDLTTFTEYILVYYEKENCQCIEKRKTKINSKCYIKSITKRTCSDKKWLFRKHSWSQRTTALKLFEEVTDSPMTTFCQHVIKTWTRSIECDAESFTSWCNTNSKRLEETRNYYIIKNCVCIRKTIRTERPCVKCPPTKEEQGKCTQSSPDTVGYSDLTITTYEVTRHNICKTVIRNLRVICRCPRTRETNFCQNGKRNYKRIDFLLQSVPPCNEEVVTESRTVFCYNNGRPNRWNLVNIEKCLRPCDYNIGTYVRYEIVNCFCILKSKKVKIGICCKPCYSLRKCIGNKNVLVSICEHPEGLKCVRTKRLEPTMVLCPRPIKKLIGRPVNCVQKYTLTTFVIKNCRCYSRLEKDLSELKCCIPKRLETYVCEGLQWKITATTFLLKNGKCHPHIKVYYRNVIINQPNELTIKDKVIDKCTFERLYYKTKIVNCREQAYFSHKKIHKKCCPRRHRVTKCRKHRIIVITIHFFILSHFYCVPRTWRKLSEIDCSHLVLQERIYTEKCKVKDIYYKAVYKNCKCGRIIVRVETKTRICCYHKTPYTTTRCDAIRGRIITTKYTFHLRNERCIRCAARRSVEVNCNRKDCHTTVSRCVDNKNVVKLFCLRRHKCRCLRKLVSQGNQCCKPNSYQWKVVGRCDSSTCYQKIKYFAFRLSVNRKLCKPVVIRVQKKRCCCPKRRHVEGPCRNDTSKLITVVTHTLNYERDTCVIHTRQFIKTITECSNQRKRVRIVSNLCNRRTGWARITSEYIQARKCRCVKSRQVRRCPCICRVAFPTVVRKYCRKNQVVTETRTAVCRKCRVRWVVYQKSTKISNCIKTIIEKGNCFPMWDGNAISIRYVSKIQYLTKKCKCVRKIIKTWKVHCECRKSRITRVCWKARILINIHRYYNKNGSCTHSLKQNAIKVMCPKKPWIKISKCRQNKYQILIRIFYRSHCRCLSKTCHRHCDCICPKRTVRKRCSGKYFIEVITTTWRKSHCRCMKYQILKKYIPNCPKYQRKYVGSCVKKGDTGYKDIILRKPWTREDVCKCFIKEQHKRKLCWCAPDTKTVQFCIRNNIFVTETSVRVLFGRIKHCKRIVMKSLWKIMSRPNDVVVYHCNRNTGRDTLTTISYRIDNCVIKPSIHKDFGRCACSMTWKRVKKGKCLRSLKCLRTDIYVRKQLVGRRCVKVKERKTVVCCCPVTSRRKYCRNNQMYTSVTTFNLRSHVCFSTRSITIKQVHCSRNIVTKKGPCNKNGYKVIEKYRYVNRNCRCVQEKIKKFRCRCRCRRASTKYYCDRIARIHTRTVTSFSIVHCKCKAKIETTKRGIKCPGKTITISRCTPVRGRDYSERTTVTTTYYVNGYCKCVQRINIDKEICWCKRNEKRRETCDRIRHVITLKISFSILRNKSCVRIRNRKRRAVCCGTGRWNLKGDSGCIANNKYGRRVLTYVRQIVVGCGCKEESRHKVCHCMCRGPSLIRKCNRNRNEIIHTHYTYKLINCQCVVTQKVQYQRIRCRIYAPIRHRCALYRHGVYREYTVYRDRRVYNCRCVTIPRITWVICKCPKMTTVRVCDQVTNVLVYIRTWYQLFPSSCRRQTERTLKPVPCDTIPDCCDYRKCTGLRKDRQVHKCIFRTLANCQCKYETRLVTRRCTGCKRKRIERGKCNRMTCVRIIKTTVYYIVVLRNNLTKCVPKVSYRKERCCCPKSSIMIKCRNNVLIKTTISYKFITKSKTCHQTIIHLNITPYCLPAMKKIKAQCQWRTTCNRDIHLTLKSLTNCKCQVRERHYTRKCCCQKDYTTVVCSRGHVISNTLHIFTLRQGRCNQKITITRRNVSCPMRRSHYESVCNPVSRTRVKVITSYILRNCKCLRLVKRMEEICKCLPSWSIEICISKMGVFRKTITSYSLDRIRHQCIESKRITERRSYCDTKVRKSCHKCKVSYKSGIYRRCTTTFGVRIGCGCVYRARHHSQLCQCRSSHKYWACHKNKVKLEIVIFYVRVKVYHKVHDIECVRKLKIVRRQRLSCRRLTIRKGPCIKGTAIYSKYYFVLIHCLCALKIKSYKVRCSCKHQEITSRKCIQNFLSVIIHKKWTLTCDSRYRIPRCRCVHTYFRQNISTACGRLQHNVGRCMGNRRRITYVRHVVKNCKCKRIKHSLLVPCSDCRREFHYCRKIKIMGLCKEELYRKYLCQFSCGYCERCPKKCATHAIGACKCHKVAGIKICSKKIEFILYKIVNRKCTPQKSVKYSLCSCSLEYSKSKCEQLKKQGRCKDKNVLRKCQFVCYATCRLCQGRVIQRRCIQSGKRKGTFEVVTVTFKRVCNSCVTEKSVIYKGKCTVCDKRLRKVVTNCMHGTRYLLTKYVQKEGNRCVDKVSRVAFSCHQCCKSTEVKIGNCVKEHRAVFTVFWANINGCCKRRIVTNVYSCIRRCSAVTNITSKCINNRQMIVRVWRSGRDCHQNSYTEWRSCIPVKK